MWDPMDVALFDKCINYITKHYKVVLLEELVMNDALKKEQNLVTISFDDGYKDNIEHAAPILKKYSCKASFYIVTDCIEHNSLTWTHILEHSFQYTQIPELKLEFDFLPVQLHTRLLPTKSDRVAYAKKLIPFLKTIAHEKREQVLETVKKTFTDCTLPKLMMNWDDIAKLNADGFFVGSHSVSHHMLGTMSDETQIKFELERSRQVILERLGYAPATISFPINSYNENTIRLSKEAGYTAGLAVHQRMYDPESDNDFEIPRIELYNESWWKTRMRITGFLEKIKTVIKN